MINQVNIRNGGGKISETLKKEDKNEKRNLISVEKRCLRFLPFASWNKIKKNAFKRGNQIQRLHTLNQYLFGKWRQMQIEWNIKKKKKRKGKRKTVVRYALFLVLGTLPPSPLFF